MASVRFNADDLSLSRNSALPHIERSERIQHGPGPRGIAQVRVRRVAADWTLCRNKIGAQVQRPHHAKSLFLEDCCNGAQKRIVPLRHRPGHARHQRHGFRVHQGRIERRTAQRPGKGQFLDARRAQIREQRPELFEPRRDVGRVERFAFNACQAHDMGRPRL
jgi:hypothetical protein